MIAAQSGHGAPASAIIGAATNTTPHSAGYSPRRAAQASSSVTSCSSRSPNCAVIGVVYRGSAMTTTCRPRWLPGARCAARARHAGDGPAGSSPGDGAQQPQRRPGLPPSRLLCHDSRSRVGRRRPRPGRGPLGAAGSGARDGAARRGRSGVRSLAGGWVIVVGPWGVSCWTSLPMSQRLQGETGDAPEDERQARQCPVVSGACSVSSCCPMPGVPWWARSWAAAWIGLRFSVLTGHRPEELGGVLVVEPGRLCG